MTERETAMLSAITEISRFKALAHIVPAYALLREIKSLTGPVNAHDAEETALSLARQGFIRTGQGINDRWCELKDKLKTTDIMNEFEKTIKAHLDKVAKEDPDFRAKYEEALSGKGKKKDIAACCNYIIAEVRKTGRQGFTDDEVFGLAMHFYDEAGIESPAKQTGVKVVVNRRVELTEEDKKRIEEEARRKVEDEERRKAEARIRAEQDKARKREEDRERKAREAAEEARKKDREEFAYGFLFGDDQM